MPDSGAVATVAPENHYAAPLTDFILSSMTMKLSLVSVSEPDKLPRHFLLNPYKKSRRAMEVKCRLHRTDRQRRRSGNISGFLPRPSVRPSVQAQRTGIARWSREIRGNVDRGGERERWLNWLGKMGWSMEELNSGFLPTGAAIRQTDRQSS